MKIFLLICFIILSLSTYSYADDCFDSETTVVVLESNKKQEDFLKINLKQLLLGKKS